MAPAIQSQGLASTRRCGVSSRPTTMPAPKIEHGVFVFEAESRQDAEPDPEPLVAGFHDADHQPGAAHPEQRLEGVHGEQVIDSENTRRHQGREGGEALGKSLAAEFAGDQGGEGHLARSGHGGQETDRRKRVAQERPHDPGDQRNQRRLVHVTPIQMPAAGQVIQLVDEIAVMPSGVQVDQKLAGGEAKDYHGGSARQVLLVSSVRVRRGGLGHQT